MGRAYLPVLAGGSFADAVVGHDVEIVTNKSFRQPQLQIQALSVAEGNGKQDIAPSDGIADARNGTIVDRLTHEPPVDSPVTGSLDGMHQRLQPQPLQQLVLAQSLWHGYGSSQAKPAWQPQLIHRIFIIALRFFGKLERNSTQVS